MFELLKTDASSKARLGRLTTPHGVVDTPVFMSVGTQGSVKAIDPRELREMAHELENRASEAKFERQFREAGAPAHQRIGQRTRRHD